MLALLQESEFRDLVAGVGAFVARSLPGASALHRDGSENAKVIADPLYGHPTYFPWEMRLVDTPLLQRLRGIHQLGLTHLVYPSLGYSRFEHALGVVARLQEILDALVQNTSTSTSPLKYSFTAQTLEPHIFAARIAALLHDCGHCLFSHVSESVMTRLNGTDTYPPAQRVLDAVAASVGRRIPLAEVLAVLMINSDPFVSYLQRIDMPHCTSKARAQTFAASVGNLVLGLPIDGHPETLFLAQLVSSALDADKLDYMLRESRGSGIHLGISKSWLLRKMLVFSLSETELPNGLRSRVRKFPSGTKFSTLGLVNEGRFAFEEFCVARLALHEKIYLQQKVRAAEVQLRGRLQQLADVVPRYKQIHHWLDLAEVHVEHPTLPLPAPSRDLFNLSEPGAFASFGVQTACGRDLPFRAFAFGWPNALSEVIDESALLPLGSPGSPTNLLMSSIDTPEGIATFMASVQEELLAILEALAEESPTPEEMQCVVMDPPKLTSLQQGHDTLYFEHNGQVPLRWTIPIDRLVDHYRRSRSLGYVFAPRRIAPHVLLACEIVVYKKWRGIFVQEDCVGRSVVSTAGRVRERLAALDHYQSMRELRPIPQALQTIEARARVNSIARNLGSFVGNGTSYVTPASIVAFVSQFPSALQLAALEWLTHVRVLDVLPIVAAITAAIADPLLANAPRIALCPLGGLKDSATHLAYLLDRALQGAGLNARLSAQLPLSEALSQGYQHVVLFDDNTNTGKQVLNIVAQWQGKQLPSELVLAEDHVATLAAAALHSLKTLKCVFAFGIGPEGAGDRLVTSLRAQGLGPEGGIACHIGEELTAARRSLSGAESAFQHAQRAELRTFAQRVGREVLAREGKGVPEAESKALGYGGTEALLGFTYNVPTMTVTCLWIRGEWSGGKWEPLLARERPAKASEE